MPKHGSSEDDCETVFFFLNHQEINESPRKMQKPITKQRVSGHDAQSESQKSFSCKRESLGKKSPRPGLALR